MIPSSAAYPTDASKRIGSFSSNLTSRMDELDPIAFEPAPRAAHLKHQRVRRNLLVHQNAGKDAEPCSLTKGFSAVHIVVIGKRRLLAEILDDIRHVQLAVTPIVGHEKLQKSIRDRITL